MIPLLIKAFFAIFGVMDPVGNVPVFISLTKNISFADKQRLAIRAIIRAGIILIIFVFLGNAILDFFYISMQSFRIAGGIILALVGLQILFNIHFGNSEEEKNEDISVVPLATPLIAGPGMITTAVIFSKEYGYLITILAITANLLLSALLFRFADRIVKLLGASGTLLFAKVMGLILVAIGVEFIRNALG